MRHFKSYKDAVKHRDENNRFTNSLKVYRKIKGQKNRFKTPFVVCTELEWLNLN